MSYKDLAKRSLSGTLPEGEVGAFRDGPKENRPCGHKVAEEGLHSLDPVSVAADR
jgi:hypothetical protein